MKRISTVVKHLHKELARIAQELDYNSKPIIRGSQIRWDGPYNWAYCVTAGCSVIAQELGGWSEPLSFEQRLHRILEIAEDNGHTVECESYYSLEVY